MQNVRLDQWYTFEVRIQSDIVNDITDELNNQLSASGQGQYGYRKVRLTKSGQWSELPINFSFVPQFYSKILDFGRFLGIGYVLVGISVLGLALFVLIGLKLFAFRRYRRRRMLRYWNTQKAKHLKDMESEFAGFRILKYGPTFESVMSLTMSD